MVCFYLPFIRSAWTSTSLLGKLVWVCGCEGVRLSLNVAANLGSLMSFVPSAGAWYGEPRKKQVERLAFFYPIRRIGMESPAGCMESVAKRRHGITAGVFLLRIDFIPPTVYFIHHFVMIPYRRQAADSIHGFAVILRFAFLYYELKKKRHEHMFVSFLFTFSGCVQINKILVNG